MLATLCLLAGLAPQEPRVVPAFTAYAAPDPLAMQRPDDGSVRDWRGTLSWHGLVAEAGELQVVLHLRPGAKAARLRLRIGDAVREGDVAEGAAQVAFDAATVAVGPIALQLACVDGPPPDLATLELRGAAGASAHFADVERRNCASVHLGYALPDDLRAGAAWF